MCCENTNTCYLKLSCGCIFEVDVDLKTTNHMHICKNHDNCLLTDEIYNLIFDIVVYYNKTGLIGIGEYTDEDIRNLPEVTRMYVDLDYIIHCLSFCDYV